MTVACPRHPQVRCAGPRCPGRSASAACDHAARLHARMAGQPPPPAPAAPGFREARPGELVIRGHGNDTGYGRMARYLATALHDLGQSVAFDPIGGLNAHLEPFIRERLVGPEYANPCVQMSSPWAVQGPGLALFSMYEASKLPPASAQTFNAGRVVIVPCEWNRRVFLDSGVTAPIRVVPLGVDAGVYHPAAGDAQAGSFTALTVAALRGGGHRKDVPGLVAAFLEALGDREDARLILKIHADDEFPDPGHPRVLIDRGNYSDHQMAELYRSASVYATMSKGEGFGLPVLEAMACGIPVVGPIHSGIAEYLTPDCAYPVAWSTAPAAGEWYDETGSGEWYPVDRGSMVRQLREAYADHDGRRAKGEIAARRALEFTWAAAGGKLLAVLREFGMVPAPTVVRPEVARQTRLSILRNACPDAEKPPGCGCSGQLACRRDGGALKTRDDCFSCLESSRKVIAMTAYSRPEILRRTLESLAECDGIGDYLILPHVDPGDDEVRALVAGIDFAECRPTWNRERMGCDRNSDAAHRHAFDLAEFAVYLDDDVLLAPDALRFYEWAAGRFRADGRVATVTAFNRNRDACPPPEDRRRAELRPWFHGSTFATWRDRWARMDGLATVDGDSWDLNYLTRFVRPGGLNEVYPVLGRCRHVGLASSCERNFALTPGWYEENHDPGHWAGNVDVGRGAWSLETTTTQSSSSTSTSA